jgi:hypothetical protein
LAGGDEDVVPRLERRSVVVERGRQERVHNRREFAEAACGGSLLDSGIGVDLQHLEAGDRCCRRQIGVRHAGWHRPAR